MECFNSHFLCCWPFKTGGRKWGRNVWINLKPFQTLASRSNMFHQPNISLRAPWTVWCLLRLSCRSVFWGLKCAWILLSDAAVPGGLSGPGVIISQVCYWAADSLIGYGCFFPSRSFIGLFIFPVFLLSIVLDLDFSLSTGQLPSLPLSTPSSKLEPILSVSLIGFKLSHFSCIQSRVNSTQQHMC